MQAYNAELEGEQKGSTAHPFIPLQIYNKLTTRTKRAIYDRFPTDNPSLEQITAGLDHEIGALRIDTPKNKTETGKTSVNNVQTRM